MAIAALVAGTVATRTAAGDWQTDETLWAAAVRSTPTSPRAHFTLGKIRLDQGRGDEAWRHFARTVELWPTFSAAWYEKAKLEAARGDLASAEASLRQAVRGNPRHAEAWEGLASVLDALGRKEEAERARRRIGKRD